MSQKVNQKTVCLIQANESSYSETFIRAHIDHLPARMRHLHHNTWYPGLKPYYHEDGKPFINGNIHFITYLFGKNILKSPNYFQTQILKRFLQKNKIDIVLAEYGLTGICVIDACLEAKVPCVVHFHGGDAYVDAILADHQNDYRQMFLKSDAIVVVSKDMEQQLLNLKAPQEKLHYNPYGVDVSLFAQAAPATAPPIFVAVGRFTDKKAPHLTLLAFKKLLDKYPSATLKMVGNGELYNPCKDMVQALGIVDNVEFLGFRNHIEVAQLMKTARAFVQHSVKAQTGDTEGTPLAILEAGASGLPVISTRHAGIKDVVIEGETGFLVEERDIDNMAEYMIKVAENPLLAGNMGAKAREHILENYSMDKSISQLWGILSNVLNHRSSCK